MKKVINGKVYDTNTATRVAEYWNGKPYNDLGYVVEDLYRKRSGEYFLYGEGGPATIYGRTVDEGIRCGTWQIKPLTEIEAKTWGKERRVEYV